MAAPSLTYSLTNNTTADADQVMQNFNDIINGITDSTKDLSINALTCAGAATLNGNVTLGNGSADDITFTGSLASTIPIKTTATYNIGSSTLGLAGIYLGANSQTTRIIGSGSMAATWTLTLPTNVGTAGMFLKEGGSGVTAWQWPNGITSAKSGDYTITDTDGIETVLVTTGSTTRTITLPTAADNAYRKIIVKKVDSGTGLVTIDGEGSETIDGATTVSLGYQYGFAELVCDGTSWHLVNLMECGNYTASTSSLSNLDAATFSAGSFMRIMNRVQISGLISVDATAASSFSFDMSLPTFVTNNFTSANLASGNFQGAGAAVMGRIESKSSSTLVTFNGFASDTAANAQRFNLLVNIL